MNTSARIACSHLLLAGFLLASSVHAQTGDGPGVLPPPSAGGPAYQTPELTLPTAPPDSETEIENRYEDYLYGSPTEQVTPQTAGPAVMAPPTSASGPVVIETVPAPPSIDPTAVTTPTPMDLVITPTPHWYQLGYWLGPNPWEGHVELGLNGSQGNNDVLSMRAGGHLKRKTKRWKFDSDLQYNKNVANSIETQNDAKLDVRLDRVLGDSRWTLFFLNNVIYDEFQAFDLQLSLTGGVGYQIFDTETLDLLGRFGAGSTREFGGPDNDWARNVLFGLDYEHRITKTQRLVATVEYYPEAEDFSRYRVVTDAGWEIDLDKPENVSLKFSIVDRYDSTPNGSDPNNFDYAMLLIWGL
ncbi:DUF481 domain-containing protein [Adhaeretor mobilis]|uniref:DUF481 domain-containing protein n=1 Tax=Adhaeretor mobilis TaxID=1930276 RepID=A0A517MQV1_9BACT|nr:DUF481 domain-containing protein [Adhaeretor mobilis]QDS97263.1 hypothetical protein HG15A2_05240 [Adhaeretor mobilis]